MELIMALERLSVQMMLFTIMLKVVGVYDSKGEG